VVNENLLALPSHPGAKIALKSSLVPHSPEKKTIIARPPRLLEWMAPFDNDGERGFAILSGDTAFTNRSFRQIHGSGGAMNPVPGSMR
jgi:hypothetical protein